MGAFVREGGGVAGRGGGGEREDRLNDFAQEHKLIIAITLFQSKKKKKKKKDSGLGNNPMGKQETKQIVH